VTKILISGYSDLVFSGLFAEDDEETNQDWDEVDYARVEVSIDRVLLKKSWPSRWIRTKWMGSMANHDRTLISMGMGMEPC
jgi:hypothetical protein